MTQAERTEKIKFLNSPYWMQKKISFLERQVSNLEDLAQRITSGTSNNGGNTISDKTGEAAVAIADAKREFLSIVKEYAQKKVKIYHVIENSDLEEVEKNVLRLRHLEFKKFFQIAQELNYSREHIHEIYNKALEKLPR